MNGTENLDVQATVGNAYTLLEADELSAASRLLDALGPEAQALPDVQLMRELIGQWREQRGAIRAERALKGVWHGPGKRDPRRAMEMLERAWSSGLPTDTANKISGEYLRAGHRLARKLGVGTPLCYSPQLHQRVLLLRASGYVIGGTLGVRGYRPGEPAPVEIVRQARPIR